MGWQFAVVLFAALVLTGVTSVWQMKRYTNCVNQMARDFRGPGRALVTGRHKGRWKGSIVALVVDVPSGCIVTGQAMSGRSVLARLQPLDDLAGPVATLAERVDGATLSAAQDALTRAKGLTAATAASRVRVIRNGTVPRSA